MSKGILNKLMNNIRKSIQDLNEKFNISGEKFRKEIEILNNQAEILKMKNSINQI
jgi:DNA-binding Lrp family transcriptional regulator